MSARPRQVVLVGKVLDAPDHVYEQDGRCIPSFVLHTISKQVLRGGKFLIRERYHAIRCEKNEGIIWRTGLLRSGTYIRVAVTLRSTCRRTEGTWSSAIVTTLDDLVVLDPSVVLFMTHKSIPTPHLQQRSVSAAASQKQFKSVPSQSD
jgi:hypothetical protein